MSLSISELINQGNYSEALNYLEELNVDKVEWKFIYKSKIMELNGHFEEAKELAENVIDSDNFQIQLAATVRLAYALWRLFQFQEGIELIQSMNDKLEERKIEMNRWTAALHNIHGLILWKNEQIDMAIKKFNNALNQRIQLNNQMDIAYSINNLGNCYLKLQDFVKAKDKFEEAKNIRVELGNKPGIAASFNSFGRLLDAKGEYNDAKQYHIRSLNLWENIGNKQFIAKSYRFLGINSILNGDEDSFLDYFAQSDELFREISNNTDLKVNSEIKHKYLDE